MSILQKFKFSERLCSAVQSLKMSVTIVILQAVEEC